LKTEITAIHWHTMDSGERYAVSYLNTIIRFSFFIVFKKNQKIFVEKDDKT